MKVFDRKTNKIDYTDEYQQGLLNYLYQKTNNKILKIIILPFFSQLLTLLDYTWLSYFKCKKFITKYKIDVNKFESQHYYTFAKLFKRQLQPQYLNFDQQSVLSVADSYLEIFDVDVTDKFVIKNQEYSLEELLDIQDIEYLKTNYYLCIYRLAIDNYHHYLYPCDGEIIYQKSINGKLHTIRDIATNKYPVYKENKRFVSVIKNNNNYVIQIEVGALLVGKINNNDSKIASSGQEKGYFSLGGSSIIVLYPKRMVNFDHDIIAASKDNIETKVSIGEKVGYYVKTN